MKHRRTKVDIPGMAKLILNFLIYSLITLTILTQNSS